jgi:hypothetical protein
MQPGGIDSGDGAVRLVRGGISGLSLSASGGSGGTLNEEGFWKKKAESVPVDQVGLIIHCRYYHALKRAWIVFL